MSFKREIAVGHQHPHSNMSQALLSIFRSYGILGLWRGCTASVTRVTIGGSIQLSTFSSAKTFITKSKIIPADSWISTLAAAMLGGFAVTALMTPFDVISTRLYNQPVDQKDWSWTEILRNFQLHAKKYGKLRACLAFYKGWSASLLRLGPHTVLSLLIWQELRKHYFSYKSKLKTNVANQIVSPTTVG